MELADGVWLSKEIWGRGMMDARVREFVGWPGKKLVQNEPTLGLCYTRVVLQNAPLTPRACAAEAYSLQKVDDSLHHLYLSHYRPQISGPTIFYLECKKNETIAY